MSVVIEIESFPKQDIMAEILTRFPHLAEAIFKELTINDLSTCLSLNRDMVNFLQEARLPWIKKIQNIRSLYNQSNDKKWNLILKTASKDLLQEIHHATEFFFDKSNSKNQWTINHITAASGQLKAFKFIMEQTEEVNPKNSDEVTPLHLAAQKGHLNILQLILKKVEDKNPKDKSGNTPIHYASQNGQIEIVKAIEDKNPANDNGDTPLHLAAKNGYLEICKHLLETGVNRNQRNLKGMAPFDVASIFSPRVRKLLNPKAFYVQAIILIMVWIWVGYMVCVST